jgi:lysozyme
MPVPSAWAISPMPKAKVNKGGAAAGIIAAALVVATPFVARWEGKRNDPYLDLVKVPTVCYGETKVPMRRYSDAECKAMLAESLRGYAEPVLARNPELANYPYALAAASSLAFNIGTKAYAGSTVARRFSAGDIAGGCDAFLKWSYAGGKQVKGLLNRRRAEREMCLTGL